MENAIEIAVGGSAANPPHLGHLSVLRALLESRRFAKVIWIPSGSRADKKEMIDANHRIAMTNRLIQALEEILSPEIISTLDVRDDDARGENTPTIDWIRRLEQEFPDAKIIWYTGADSVVPQDRFDGKCEIEARWRDGKTLMEKYAFLIIPRESYPDPKTLNLPSQFEVMPYIDIQDISGSEIRRLIAQNDPRFETLVPQLVADYIKENHLYGWQGDKK